MSLVDVETGEVLYVLGSTDSPFVKIGRTTDLSRRLDQIQSMSPLRLSVLWSEPSHLVREADLHQWFQAFRHHGEWFKLGPEAARLVADAYTLIFEFEFEKTLHQITTSITCLTPSEIASAYEGGAPEARKAISRLVDHGAAPEQFPEPI